MSPFVVYCHLVWNVFVKMLFNWGEYYIDSVPEEDHRWRSKCRCEAIFTSCVIRDLALILDLFSFVENTSTSIAITVHYTSNIFIQSPMNRFAFGIAFE